MPENDLSLESTYLFLVNEFGEFSELLQVANSVKENKNAKCVFLFAREPYGEFSAHSAIANSHGHEAISMSYDELQRLDWEKKFSDKAQNGYLPENIWRHRFQPLSWLVLPTMFLYMAIYLFILMALSPIISIWLIIILLRMLYRKSDLQFNNYLKNTLPLITAPISYKRYARWRHHSRTLIKTINPDLIVMGQYYPGSYNAIVTQTHKRIPAIVVPFAMGTTREIAESLYRSNQNHLAPGIFSYLIRALYPAWVNTYKGKRLIRLPIDEIIVLHIMAIREKLPWVPNCGTATLLCLSQENLEYYTKAGMTPEKLRNSGGIWNDKLSEAMRRKEEDVQAIEGIFHSIRTNRFQQDIAGQIGFNVPALEYEGMDSTNLPKSLNNCEEIIRRNDTVIEQIISDVEQNKHLYKKRNEIETSQVRARGEVAGRNIRKGVPRRIVISWPTNQYPRLAWSFESYEEFCEYLLEFLGKIQSYWNVEILISLHPTIQKILSKNDFEVKGLSLISWPLLDYIHTADIFIANVSSTIFWAIQCGIPVINFDAYRYGYTEFKKAGCESVEIPRDFEKSLVRLLSEPEFYDDVKERIMSQREYWTHPEGGSRERILQFLNEEASRAKSQSSSAHFIVKETSTD